jgi:hypothetical protein
LVQTAMPVAMTFQGGGLAAFVAFGLRWADPSRTGDLGGDFARRACPQPAIDVVAERVDQAPQLVARPEGVCEIARPAVLGPLTYGPPCRPGTSPSLHFAAHQPGQLLDAVV